MNDNTGKVYEGAAIEKAAARGEHLVPISAATMRRVREGRRLLAQKLRANRRRKRQRARDRMSKASRKGNR